MAAFTTRVNDLCVDVDGDTSSDPDGDPLSFTWDFGDGTGASGAQASHCYAASGTYLIELSVSDGALSDSENASVTVDGGTGGGNCSFIIQNQWSSGFTAVIRISNPGATAIDGWTVNWTLPNGFSLVNAWNAQVSGSNPYSAHHLSWNRVIAPGQSVEFGMQGSGSGNLIEPEVEGSVCN